MPVTYLRFARDSSPHFLNPWCFYCGTYLLNEFHKTKQTHLKDPKHTGPPRAKSSAHVALRLCFIKQPASCGRSSWSAAVTATATVLFVLGNPLSAFLHGRAVMGRHSAHGYMVIGCTCPFQVLSKHALFCSSGWIVQVACHRLTRLFPPLSTSIHKPIGSKLHAKFWNEHEKFNYLLTVAQLHTTCMPKDASGCGNVRRCTTRRSKPLSRGCFGVAIRRHLDL